MADNRTKKTGAHYTPKLLADFLASHLSAAYMENPHRRPISVLDPAVGDGELLLSLLRSLHHRQVAVNEVLGFDTDAVGLGSAHSRITETFPGTSIRLVEGDFLEYATSTPLPGGNHDLFPATVLRAPDIIITNPPYVRTQVLGAERAHALASAFRLRGRVDIYNAFLHAYANLLRPGGLLGVIVSNRFMTVKAGEETRRLFTELFDLLRIWDLGDTRLFNAAVLPSVIVARRREKTSPGPSGPTPFTALYLEGNTSSTPRPEDVFDVLRESTEAEETVTRGLHRRDGYLATGDSTRGIWRLASPRADAWLERVDSKTHCTFGDVGRIRVGVKTTADSVFIRDDWASLPRDEQPEVLRRLITHRVAGHIRPTPTEIEPQILYTHEIRDGKRAPIDLSLYPRAARYLRRHQERLGSRAYVQQAGRKWYEIWVPQDPAAWELPKIVLRDIAVRPVLWFEGPGSVVNGDCYWLVNEQGNQDLVWLLLGVGNSSLALRVYDYRYQNRLYAGRRRFMSQYVERFPLPDPDTRASRQIIAFVRSILESDWGATGQVDDSLLGELDELVGRAFDLSVEEVAK